MKTSTLMDRDNVMNWNESECMTFLANNWGYHGVNGQGITRQLENRTLENMRKEVIFQIEYNYIHG